MKQNEIKRKTERHTSVEVNGLVRILAWRELALRYLESYNPRIEHEMVIVNMIVDYDAYIPYNQPLRYNANNFVETAVRMIEYGKPADRENPATLWIQSWLATDGVFNANKGYHHG